MNADSASIAAPHGPAAETSSAIHSLNVRVCHWINVVACVYLLWSGVHIFLDFPELYWGNTGYRGYPAAFRLADWGLSWDEAGALGDRRWGRNHHFTVAWVFLVNGLVYVVWNLYSRHFRTQMLPAREERRVAHVLAELRDHWRRRSRGHTTNGNYGTLQKTSYLILIFVFVPLMILTGIAQSPGFTAAMPWLLDLFGGRQSARTLHTIGTVALVLFVVVHVIEVAAAGFFIRVRSMIIGK
jgi:thiosulfate reductase cytochrome b subunit